MLDKLRPRSIYDVMAAIGCFAALATGTAYAANTIRSADIVDGEVKTADVANQDLTGGDIKDGSLTTYDMADGAGVVGADIVNNTVTSPDIQDLTIRNFDLDSNAITSRAVSDYSLKDDDVGQSTFVNFLADIGNVGARSCVNRPLTGINAQGDHLLLEASSDGSSSDLIYTVEYRTSSPDAFIKVCNPTDLPVNDSFTRFNLLVFDATPF